MALVGLVDRGILSVYWFRDENGNAANVNWDSYGKMLNDNVLPRIKNKARRERWWFQQDGALLNTRRLTSKCYKHIPVPFNFEESRSSLAMLQPRSESTRLLVLGYCMQEIRRQYHENMQQLCTIVRNICNNTPTEIVRKSVNINRQVQFCLQCNGVERPRSTFLIHHPFTPSEDLQLNNSS